MNAYIVNQETGTIIDVVDDKVLFFGFKDFKEKIINGNCCFICGAVQVSKIFNNEHVIPEWILRRFDLFEKHITLPNNTQIKYANYTIPCCKDCNSELGNKIEIPISEFLKKPYKEIVEELSKNDEYYISILNWIGLLYFKTHFKDTMLLMERDKRISAGKIGDNHYWEDLHHIHCMARSFYTKANVAQDVYGTLLVFPSIIDSDRTFDYIDSLAGQAVMIQIGQTYFIAVLNDCHACTSAFSKYLAKIRGRLTPYQIRDLFARIVHINVNIKNRPVFSSNIGTEGYEINAIVPEKLDYYSGEQELINYDELLHFYIEKYMDKGVPNRKQILESILKGKMQYLFNEKQEFLSYE